MKDIKATMLDRAKAVRNDVRCKKFDVVSRYTGICHAMLRGMPEDERNAARKVLYSLFATWEHTTGDSGYPVPLPSSVPEYEDAEHEYECLAAEGEANTTMEQYIAEYAYEHCQLWEGLYGELRMELLDHIIDQLTEQLQ